ncbi:TPA: DUF1015 domain-containing protein [Candidatus Poribacteria bacterium]|nr:DUF1015 domain-containing protein [Candidatus Poribacteria bacterium]HEX30201.1 DUF1015 domain-containing protein [Candidatus Poribacteria bacterium]
MPEIRPFRGVLYDTSRVRIEEVVTPPYDVISDREKEFYKSLNPYNMVYLLLEPDYPKAAERFRRWLREGVLKQDDRPAIYIYRQEFPHGGRKIARLGFIARMRIADGDELMPHENTFEGPKMDRLRLLQHVGANLSPIFSVFDDPQNHVENLLREVIRDEKPRVDVLIEGVTHQMWSVDEKVVIGKVAEKLSRSYAFIADGHHRYESARIYRDLMRSKLPRYSGEEPFNFVMSYFVSVSDEGLIILPTHRVLVGADSKEIRRRIEKFFESEVVRDLDEMFERMRERAGEKSPPIGLYDGERFRVLVLRDSSTLSGSVPEMLRDLDVTVLHALLIPSGGDLRFTRDPLEVLRSVRATPSSFGFFLNPIDPGKVREVALAGERMPHKSTYFYPKPLSGLVINKHD